MTVNVQEIIDREIEKQFSKNTTDDLCQLIRESILKVLQTEELDSEALDFNIPFWVQALLRNPSTILRVDDPYKIFYPHVNHTIPLTKIPQLDTVLQHVPIRVKLWYFVKNIAQIQKDFEVRAEEIREALTKGNLIIVSNHASWLNLPLIAICLHLFCGISKEAIYTLL